MNIKDITTPAALVNVQRMDHNIAHMQQRMDELGVRFRPHVKTTKCVEIVKAQIKAGARGITVSTLKEAEQFFAAGISDILYAVGIAGSKLPQALSLRRKGCRLTLITDNVESARAITDFGQKNSEQFDVLLEIDTDGHRSGIAPDSASLIEVANVLCEGGARVQGVLTHAGASYDLNTPEALQAMAEQERSGCVRAAQRLRAAGFDAPVVSVGSTPTALSARHLEGVTEVRAGVYVFFDLVMTNVGVAKLDDIALGVLTTVIGHQAEKGWAIVDAGWMAMSRDRGTQKQATDFGYGQVCRVDGTPLDSYILSGANQEHGVLSLREGVDRDIVSRFPIGSQLLVLPNHACATATQFDEYYAVGTDGNAQVWPRFHGW